MRTWSICLVVGALAVVGVYLSTAVRNTPELPAQPAAPAPVASAPTAPPAPVVLAEVVDVTDIDPLLDPPAIPAAEAPARTGPMLTAVGYEDRPPKPVTPANVVPIPPAATDEEPADRVVPVELMLLFGLIVPDASEQQVAPPPRAVIPTWEEEFRQVIPAWEREFQPALGPLLLDMTAARARHPERPVERFVMFSGAMRPVTFEETVAATPLGPLFALADFDLLKPVPATPTLSGTGGKWVWVADPVGSVPMTATIRRMYAVFHAANQAPATRLEWYTRWYGEGRLSDHLNPVIIATQPPQPLFSFVSQVFGGN